MAEDRRRRPGADALRKAREALQRELRDKQLQWDEGALEAYSHDESEAGSFPPDLVVFAESAADVSRTFALGQSLGVPVTPCAARTGRSGGSIPLYGGIALSLERMNRILSISTEDLIATVQPGLITGELMKAVEAKGLFYPPDPNSFESCTIGGNVAENAGGPRALKYGVTKDYVIGMEWVLPSGEIIRVGRQTIKGVAGYDLVGLFVGSEGTLGVATEITLQLLPLPKFVKTALVIFPDVFAAARAVSAILAGGLLPRTLELLDELSIRAVDGRGFSFPPNSGSAVIVEVDGNADEPLFGELEEIGRIAVEHGAIDTLVAQNEEQRQKLWASRRIISPSLRAMRPYKIAEDIAVPRSKIPIFVERFKRIGEEMGLLVATYGHAGDGNLHANILYDSLADKPKVDLAIDRMLRLTVELSGTITGEHGVGLAKRDFLPLEQSKSVILLQKKLKSLLDPAGLLNPGKIFPEG